MDVLLAEVVLAGWRAGPGEGLGAVGLGLGGPLGDEFRVGARLQGFAVAGDLGVAFGDHAHGVLGLRRGGGVWLGRVHAGDRVVEAVRGEGSRKPSVQRRDQVSFGEVDVARVGDLVGERVFVGEAAAVVQDVAAALTLHASSADPAVQQAAHDVRVAGALPLAGRVTGALGFQQGLGVLEGLGVDQRLVGLVGGPDPGVRLSASRWRERRIRARCLVVQPWLG
nr:hypothetical protein [Streptomyces capitiformicae]